MSAPIAIDKFVENYAKTITNEQKFLNYFPEIYDYYVGKLPDNKYIYYLDENSVIKPASSLTPECADFVETNPVDLSLLVPQIRIFKEYVNKKIKVEFPFDNKMNFDSFKDPRNFFGKTMPFVTERFAGDAVGLTSLNVRFEGIGGKANTENTNAVFVDLEMHLQDPKMLFKDLHDTHPIQYKDLFAEPLVHHYYILLELGYSAPANYSSTLSSLTDLKLSLKLNPLGATTSFTYNENGSLTLKTTLSGRAETEATAINLFSTRYYSALKGKLNMQQITEEFLWSSKLLLQKRNKLAALRKSTDSAAQKAKIAATIGRSQIDATQDLKANKKGQDRTDVKAAKQAAKLLQKDISF